MNESTKMGDSQMCLVLAQKSFLCLFEPPVASKRMSMAAWPKILLLPSNPAPVSIIYGGKHSVLGCMEPFVRNILHEFYLFQSFVTACIRSQEPLLSSSGLSTFEVPCHSSHVCPLKVMGYPRGPGASFTKGLLYDFGFVICGEMCTNMQIEPCCLCHPFLQPERPVHFNSLVRPGLHPGLGSRIRPLALVTFRNHVAQVVS